MSKQLRLLIIAGGTGGHVFPGVAVAQYWIQQGFDVVWLGTVNGIDSKVVPEAGIRFKSIVISGLRGKGKWALVRAPLAIAKAFWSARRLIKQWQPDVALAMGGYVCGPAGLAVRSLGISLILHEQNAVAGKTNSLLSKVAQRVLCAYGSAFPHLPRKNRVGNPVRQSFIDSFNDDYQPSNDKIKLLVIGGSQGSKAINDVISQLVLTPFAAEHLSIMHQVGHNNIANIKPSMQQCSTDYQPVAFIDNMARAYQAADIVVCRSGALTVAELCCVGRTAIFVPFPYAVDDHQTKNVEALVAAGCACLIPQAQLNVERLLQRLKPLVADRVTLQKKAQQMRQFAKPNATEQVAQACLALCRGQQNTFVGEKS